MWVFTAYGKPQTKKRPRLGRGKRAYTPPETKAAEAELARQYDGPLFEGKVHVKITLGPDQQVVQITEVDDFENLSKLRGDIDNYAKLTLDALNKKAWNDDSQIVKLTIEKL